MSIDIALKQLQQYTGTNPIPNDFHAFWQARVQEAQSVQLDYHIEDSEITGYTACNFYNLWFRGIHGETLYAKYVRSNTFEKIPLVLQFHGYPGSSRSWFEQASVAGMGKAIIALECPGQGGKSQDSGNYKGTTVSGHIIAGLDGDPKDMYYVKLYQNICVLMRIVMQLDGIDTNHIYVNGASQGGGLAAVCAALHPQIVKKAALLYTFLSDFERVYDLGRDEIAYEGLRYYMRWFDPMGKRKKEIFTKLGYIDIHNFAPMIKADVMYGFSLADEVCPPSTQFAFYNQLHTSKKGYYFYEYGHEEIPMFDDMILDFLQENSNDKGI